MAVRSLWHETRFGRREVVMRVIGFFRCLFGSSFALAAACGGGVAEAPSDDGAQADTADTAASSVPTLPPTTTWRLDIENPVSESEAVDWYDVDLWDNVDSGLIGRLHAKGRKVVCYFSAGSAENWRPDYASFPRAALGKAMNGWAGERWVDVRSSGLRNVMKARLDKAKAAGCDGVDPDNVDGYSNDTGFALRGQDQLSFNRFLAKEAHARGMVVGLKNDVDQIADLVASFDFAVNEQCFEFDECDKVARFVAAGKSVINIEYGSVSSHQRSVCPTANEKGFFSILSAENRMNGTYTRCRP